VDPCALVHRFSTFGLEPDPDTGMCVAVPDYDNHRYRDASVIRIDYIIRGAHLLPVFYKSKLPNALNYTHSLDYFCGFYLNGSIDPHMFKLMRQNLNFMVDVEEGKVGGKVVGKLKCLPPLRRSDENAGSDRSEKM
jgi:hypothetical protein